MLLPINLTNFLAYTNPKQNVHSVQMAKIYSNFNRLDKLSEQIF